MLRDNPALAALPRLSVASPRPSGYGALRHSVEGHVDMMAVLFMISGAMLGAQFGSMATSFVRGPAIRYILSYSLVLATAGACMRLIYVLTGGTAEWLDFVAVVSEQWTVEGGFVTPTLKLKRNVLEKHYEKHFEAWAKQRKPVVWHSA